jgi:hypothetical protein
MTELGTLGPLTDGPRPPTSSVPVPPFCSWLAIRASRRLQLYTIQPLGFLLAAKPHLNFTPSLNLRFFGGEGLPKVYWTFASSSPLLFCDCGSSSFRACAGSTAWSPRPHRYIDHSRRGHEAIRASHCVNPLSYYSTQRIAPQARDRQRPATPQL